MAKRPPPNRSDPTAHRAMVRAANKARYRATKVLIARHQFEFDTLYAREAAVMGVEPKPRMPVNINLMERQLRELEEQLAKARKAHQNGDGRG